MASIEKLAVGLLSERVGPHDAELMWRELGAAKQDLLQQAVTLNEFRVEFFNAHSE